MTNAVTDAIKTRRSSRGSIFIPPVKCPEGFEIHQSEYIIKGICPACSGNGRDSG